MIEGIMEYAASPVNDSFCTEWGHIRVEVLTTQALSGCVLGSRSRQRWVLGKRELRKKIVLNLIFVKHYLCLVFCQEVNLEYCCGL